MNNLKLKKSLKNLSQNPDREWLEKTDFLLSQLEKPEKTHSIFYFGKMKLKIIVLILFMLAFMGSASVYFFVNFNTKNSNSEYLSQNEKKDFFKQLIDNSSNIFSSNTVFGSETEDGAYFYSKDSESNLRHSIVDVKKGPNASYICDEYIPTPNDFNYTQEQYEFKNDYGIDSLDFIKYKDSYIYFESFIINDDLNDESTIYRGGEYGLKYIYTYDNQQRHNYLDFEEIDEKKFLDSLYDQYTLSEMYKDKSTNKMIIESQFKGPRCDFDYYDSEDPTFIEVLEVDLDNFELTKSSLYKNEKIEKNLIVQKSYKVEKYNAKNINFKELLQSLTPKVEFKTEIDSYSTGEPSATVETELSYLKGLELDLTWMENDKKASFFSGSYQQVEDDTLRIALTDYNFYPNDDLGGYLFNTVLGKYRNGRLEKATISHCFDSICNDHAEFKIYRSDVSQSKFDYSGDMGIFKESQTQVSLSINGSSKAADLIKYYIVKEGQGNVNLCNEEKCWGPYYRILVDLSNTSFMVIDISSETALNTVINSKYKVYSSVREEDRDKLKELIGGI